MMHVHRTGRQPPTLAVVLAALAVVVGCASAASVASLRPKLSTYDLDTTWNMNIAGATQYTAVAVHGDEVFVGQRTLTASPILVLATTSGGTGALLREFGNGTISTNLGTWGVHGMAIVDTPRNGAFLYVTDVGDHTVKRFTLQGDLEEVLGTSGHAGSGLSPLQFGNVADVSFDAHGRYVYVGDGDGGVNNRVLALEIGGERDLIWAAGGAAAGSGPAQFSSPHSVVFDPATGLLLVADRGNNRTQALEVATGRMVDQWTCMRPGSPWGMRILHSERLLFQADGGANTLTIFPLGGATGGSLGACNVMQTFTLDPHVCAKPHELAVDQATGNVYMACVAVGAGTNVIRFVPH